MRLYRVVRPVLFSLPAETAHRLVHRLLHHSQGTPLAAAAATHYRVDDPRLTVEAFGQSFPNPVGVAAGFDKNARIPTALVALGFGHVEVGAVTADPQAGNPRPRLFRLVEDRALINRMGFNNDGAEAVGRRIAGVDPGVPLGVNLGKSKDVPLDEAPADYRQAYESVRAADYFVVNVSSPNTPGLRELQQREHLERILETLRDAGAAPLLVKLSPDLSEPALEAALDVVNDLDLDGVIAVNTTAERPDGLASPNRAEEGGLSGAPLEDRATELVAFVASRTDVPIVGVGGVDSPEAAYRKIRAGASLVQLYTALVYHGPSVARHINRGLASLLARDGFDSVEEAVGADR